MAIVAGRNAHQLFHLPSQDAAFCIPPAAGEHRQEPFKLGTSPSLGPSTIPRDFYFFEAGAIEPDIFLERCEILPRRVQECADGELALGLSVRRHADKEPPHPARHIAEAPQDSHRSLFQRPLWRSDEFGGIDAVNVAQPIACWAGSLRAIETEELRFWRCKAEAAPHAGIAAGENQIVGRRLDWLAGHDHLSATGAKRQIHCLGQSAAARFVWHKPVHDDIDRMLEEFF